MHPSILLIIPYFGRFNNYFKFFLKSCENNPTVNWLIITDDQTPYSYPKNVKIKYQTFSDLRSSIQDLFDFSISLETPYKLCDYKPAYGYIFAEEIKDYDFWGYCDNDLIFGNIRQFITDDILRSSDKVLSRGHLSIYRNTPYMNRFVFEHTNDFYKTVYTSSCGFSFDEWGQYGVANHLKRELKPELFWDGFPFEDLLTTASNFVPAQKRNEAKSHIVYGYNNGNLMKYYVSEGVVRCDSVLYVHFQKRSLNLETSNVLKYLIVPNKIIAYEEPTLTLLKKYGKRKLFNRQYLKIKYGNIKRHLKFLNKK